MAGAPAGRRIGKTPHSSVFALPMLRLSGALGGIRMREEGARDVHKGFLNPTRNLSLNISTHWSAIIPNTSHGQVPYLIDHKIQSSSFIYKLDSLPKFQGENCGENEDHQLRHRNTDEYEKGSRFLGKV